MVSCYWYIQHGKNFSFCTLLLASFDRLDDLFYQDCPRPTVICGHFAEGLASAIAKREVKHQENGHDQTYILQLYESFIVRKEFVLQYIKEEFLITFDSGMELKQNTSKIFAESTFRYLPH